MKNGLIEKWGKLNASLFLDMNVIFDLPTASDITVNEKPAPGRKVDGTSYFQVRPGGLRYAICNWEMWLVVEGNFVKQTPVSVKEIRRPSAHCFNDVQNLPEDTCDE